MLKTCKILLFAGITLVAACSQGDRFNFPQVLEARPETGQLIFDYVGLMQGLEESAHRHLETIRDRYQIEILIAVLPDLGRGYTINQAAVEIFSNWQIGREYQSRGILLLLADDAKEVKLEVGFELEDVFTDLLTGHIEDRQLPAHYHAGNLEIGLIAVLEELESRAQVKFKGGYNRADIADMDAVYLSQGAGASHELNDHPDPVQFSKKVNRDYPAGSTPQQAWRTMLARWRDKTRDPYLEVFTPLTRLAYRDFTQLPDSHFEKEYRTYADKAYQILKDGDFAVVYFGKKKGWDNAPFLLCRTSEGWQFDLVHQRRFIRMGPAPQWGVEFSEHPHMALLMDSFQFKGQDIPLEGDDRYTIDRDAELANRILAHETLYRDKPKDFDTALDLGRLYTLASMSRKGIKLLQHARQINPQDPRPYKYLAIGHVNAHYQYDTALKALNAYIERQPQDPFGHNFAGYIHYRKKAYTKAARSFEKALALKPDNCYAHFYLAYTYAGLYDRAPKADPRRQSYKSRFNHHVAQTRTYRDRHPIRVHMLNQWLAK